MLPKRINKLEVLSLHNEFVNEINTLSSDGSWKSFKEGANEVCFKILGFAVNSTEIALTITIKKLVLS